MRALILVAGAALACSALASCDPADNDQANVSITNNDATIATCPDGSTVPVSQPCPTVPGARGDDSHVKNVDAPTS